MQAARSSSSVGSVGCSTSHDEASQAIKRRKLEEPQHSPLAAEAVTLGSERDDRVDTTVTGQVRKLLAATIAATVAATAKRPAGAEERTALRRATHALADLAKQEHKVDTIVAEGGIQVVVPLLSLFRPEQPSFLEYVATTTGGEEVEKEACFVMGLLAIKAEHQHAIADKGALTGLVGLLKQQVPSRCPPGPGASVARRAADAITNLAHENVGIKCRVRAEGGIPPLVALLESFDSKVQRAAAGALRTLAFKNEENKNLIVECNALPTLIQMLRSADVGIHYEAVGVIGNLVHSSLDIKQAVLQEGALQPVIGLLTSKCAESQREAALLLGQFAVTTDEYKAKIVQRGAMAPLIAMLIKGDLQLKEMAAFALGRLAQNVDNQAGVVEAGGLLPLLELLESRNGNLQHNAAFALYGLAENDDNVADLVRHGGVQRLQQAELIVQASKDCVQKTIKRLEEKVTGKVLHQILYTMYSGDISVQRCIAIALTRLATTNDLKQAFVDRRALHVLVDMLLDGKSHATKSEAASALYDLTIKANATALIDLMPSVSRPPVYLGEQFVNNETLSDVTFIVEGRKFYAHRIALLASSDAFRAMFEGDYREKAAVEIPIPNIRFEVFERMMLCIYTGRVEVSPALAQELLQAADQYMLDGLKRLAEATIGSALSVAHLPQIHELADDYAAPQLGHACALYALGNYEELVTALSAEELNAHMRRMVPMLSDSLTKTLVALHAAPAAPDAPLGPSSESG